MKRIQITENGIYLVFETDDEGCLRFRHFSTEPLQEALLDAVDTSQGYRLVEINLSGYDRPFERMGNKYIITAPGWRMKDRGMTDTRNTFGRLLTFHLADEVTGVTVDAYMQFYDGIPVVRTWNTVTNQGKDIQTLDYVSSFNYEGLGKEGDGLPEDKLKIKVVHNGWQREVNWKDLDMRAAAMDPIQREHDKRSSSFLHVENTGNWSTKEYLPMGYVENTATDEGLLWQIEQNGSWHWEIGDRQGYPYLALSGPNETYSHWFKDLKPGDSFTTVPAAVACVKGGFDAAVGAMTQYRRLIRRKNADNETLKVIFNDYMNCLWGDPTTEKEIPLIDAAARAGCEYFVIDCGWYADGGWWNEVGDWLESKRRFPNGVREVTDYIRSKGMIPGVWLELEVMGVNCHMATTMPDSWFFVRHGRRVYDRGRYQLDYRNPEVRAYADSVIDRLVRDYGVGYIKMDYNIEPGIGTETNADSAGDGLLGHERAYLQWLDGVFSRYPDLVIENCSSGGLRMDYAMLSRYSIQSTSDQEDYRNYCTIAANSPSALTPEQSAIWSYPLREGDREEVVFNMVNAMLLRIHQSGQLAEISPERFALVKEGIEVYKAIRQDIKKAVPFWPIGLSNYDAEWTCLGLCSGTKRYVAVWRREGSQDKMEIPLGITGKARVQCLYPSFDAHAYVYNQERGTLRPKMGNMTARLFVVDTDLHAL